VLHSHDRIATTARIASITGTTSSGAVGPHVAEFVAHCEDHDTFGASLNVPEGMSLDNDSTRPRRVALVEVAYDSPNGACALFSGTCDFTVRRS
jgi:hypothetical protein